MKKKGNIVIGAVVSIVLLVSCFVFILTKSNSFEKDVDLFLTAICDKEYELAYDYIDVPKEVLKSEIALKSSLTQLGVNADEIKSYKVNSSKEKSNVIVNITNNDNSKTKVEFKVGKNGIELPYVTNYKITVPSGTIVKLNEFIVDNALAKQIENVKQISYKQIVNDKEETQSVDIPVLLDVYEIPALLNTTHNLILEHPQGLQVNEQIDLTNEYVVNELIGDENLTNVFAQASKLFIGTVIDSVVTQKDFADVNKLISPNSQYKGDIETAYNQLKEVFSGVEKDEVKVTYDNYKLVDISMNDVYIVNKNKVTTLIQYNLAYTEVRSVGTTVLTKDKTAQKIGILTFDISDDGTLLLDSSQGIFNLHQ